MLPPIDCGASWLLEVENRENRDCSVPNTRSCWWNGHMWFLVRPKATWASALRLAEMKP